jgi:hypothetical protein
MPLVPVNMSEGHVNMSLENVNMFDQGSHYWHVPIHHDFPWRNKYAYSAAIVEGILATLAAILDVSIYKNASTSW